MKILFLYIILLFLYITNVLSYQYLTVYTWQQVRKILKDNNFDDTEKNKLKLHIYHNYKYRAYLERCAF